MNIGVIGRTLKQKQLLVNYEESYEVSFIWMQAELIRNNRSFQCGTVTCAFITDSGEFAEK